MNPHFIFPASVLNPRMIDEAFQEQAIALKSAGFNTSVIDEQGFIRPRPEPGAVCVFRGWMMKPEEYWTLHDRIQAADVTMLTSTDHYHMAHYLPNWYPLLKSWTPESRLLNAERSVEELCAEINAFGYVNVFIKDYVKSIKTGKMPFFPCPVKPEELKEVLDNMVKFRGEIEGGLVVREVEEFYPNSETRYFVINGRPHAQAFSFDTRALDLLMHVAKAVPCPFFSVDIAQRSDGRMRIVEIGDGQVSDLVGWTPERFAAIWQEAARAVPVVASEGMYDDD